MKVKELMKLLSEVDPEAEILTSSSNFEQNYALVKARIGKQSVTRETRTFRDAFDGETYVKECFTFDKDGEQAIVIS